MLNLNGERRRTARSPKCAVRIPERCLGRTAVGKSISRKTELWAHEETGREFSSAPRTRSTSDNPTYKSKKI